MHPDVAQLVRERRLLEAARVASERGDAHDASTIFEQACEWRSAAKEAIRAGELARGIELAVYGGDEKTAEQAVSILVQEREAAHGAAARLTARGQNAWAARLLEGCGEELEAARSWELAGNARRAASLFERSGERAEAERVLQTAVRRDAEAWHAALSLGDLQWRLGQWEAAARTLQRIPENRPERREALAPLADCLKRLGFAYAAAEALAELRQLGPPSDKAPILLSAETSAFQSEERLFGRYEVVREVASSEHARLLEGTDALGQERVAIKILSADGGADDPFVRERSLARLMRDISAIRSLSHPNVVPLRELLPEARSIVSLWMPGGSLGQALARGQPFAPARAVEIACAVLAALGAAHRIGIVHRDVKPSNVLFDAAGGAHLGDFGIAHWADVSATLTPEGLQALSYMSPEQRKAGQTSVRSDVFAVGVLLQEMLTGEKPSPRQPPARWPSDIHRPLEKHHDAVVARMMAEDPAQRPQHAIDARELLLALPWAP